MKLAGDFKVGRGGYELTPMPSFTGSAWAEWEPNRRGGCCAASRRDEAAKRLAANMAEVELVIVQVVMTVRAAMIG